MPVLAHRGIPDTMLQKVLFRIGGSSFFFVVAPWRVFVGQETGMPGFTYQKVEGGKWALSCSHDLSVC